MPMPLPERRVYRVTVRVVREVTVELEGDSPRDAASAACNIAVQTSPRCGEHLVTEVVEIDGMKAPEARA